MSPNLFRYQVLAALLVFLGGLSNLRAQSPVPEEKAFPVSLIRVIANPEKFDGHRLRVMGVLDYGGGPDESVCLYLSETDARNAVMANCIYVDQSVDKGDKYLGKYVILNATFHYYAGHGLEYLSFKQISDMKLWPPQQGKKE
jgi:hypothetical protein